jgi:hypothetical protein
MHATPPPARKRIAALASHRRPGCRPCTGSPSARATAGPASDRPGRESIATAAERCRPPRRGLRGDGREQPGPTQPTEQRLVVLGLPRAEPIAATVEGPTTNGRQTCRRRSHLSCWISLAQLPPTVAHEVSALRDQALVETGGRHHSVRPSLALARRSHRWPGDHARGRRVRTPASLSRYKMTK